MDRFLSGHASCPGCAMALAVRFVLRSVPPDAVVIVAPSCLGIMMGPMPLSSVTVPVFHTAFETTAAAASGLARAYRARGEQATVVCLAGDGGTYDIGLQALSGAAERNENFIYVCFDNEAYQNTGNQKSSATPWGARTASTPGGKSTRKKEIMEIIAAHRIPYAATASPAHPQDLEAKVRRASGVRGTRFLLITCPCVPGWGIGDDASLRVLRLGVESRAVPLYEIEDGTRYRITHEAAGIPVGEYLSPQGRFAHLSDAEIGAIQADVDLRWEALLERAGSRAHGREPSEEESRA